MITTPGAPGADAVTRDEFESRLLFVFEQIAELNKRVFELEEMVQGHEQIINKKVTGDLRAEDKLYLALKTRGKMTRKEVNVLLSINHPQAALRIMDKCTKKYKDTKIVKDSRGRLYIIMNAEALT